MQVPVLGMIPTSEEHEITDRLGPDLCSPSGPPDVDDLAARLLREPDRELAGALLDQAHVAGFGNVYANDVPFIVGVSPFQPVASVHRLRDLVAVGTALIRTNADRGPQNTTGRRLQTDARWVHGVGRRPCPICGNRLDYRREEETSWRRSITWCPGCQPEVDHRHRRPVSGATPDRSAPCGETGGVPAGVSVTLASRVRRAVAGDC